MALSPWLTLRQAKEALRNGRPDDAHRLLDPLLADGHRRAWKLAREVAIAYVARGERHLRADNPEAAWKELLAAESLNTGEAKVASLRHSLTRIGLAECRAALEAGNPLHVIETAARLRGRNTFHPELTVLEEAAQDWVIAIEMADRGDFLLANNTVEKIRPRLAGPTTGLDRFQDELRCRHEKFRSAVAKLTVAAEAHDWRQAARCADEVIAVAPNHREARQVQMRAWEVVQPETLPYIPANGNNDSALVPLLTPVAEESVAAFAETRTHPGLVGSKPGQVDPHFRPAAVVAPTLTGTGLPKRFLLWVDGVGGYLVCLSNRVTFGQATADGPIDVPLFADVSRLHAEMSRDSEGYILESTRGVQVNGTSAARAVLRCGDRVTLGTTCQFIFRQPVPISPSARLELASGHRLPLAVDGVLLMADNLILGPKGQVHVCIPWVKTYVILYRSKDGLGVRAGGCDFRVDNKPYRDRAALPLPAVVSSDSFTFAVEPVGTRL
jgi:hypothetical protein